jgi:hypothetical protein
MTTIATVLAWRPGRLSGVGDALNADRRALVDLQDELDAGAPPPTWQTTSAIAALNSHHSLQQRLNDLVAEVASVVTAVDAAQGTLETAQVDLEAALSMASANGFSVDRAGGRVTDQLPAPEDAAEAADRQALCDEIVDRIEQALRTAAHADAELTAALRSAISGTVDGGVGSTDRASTYGEQAGAPELLPPPEGGSDHDMFAWWNGLTEAEQLQVIADDPGWIGNTDGIPAWARDQANRALIDDYRAELEAEAERLQQNLDDNIFGGAFTNDDIRLRSVQEKLAGLDQVEETLALGGRQLLTLDITGDEQLMAAVAVGNVDTADHVAVFTPGFTTTVEGSLGNYDEDMALLASRAELESEIRGDGGTVATVSWLGYEAPQMRDALDPFGTSVGSDELAQRGSGNLAAFYNGLDASRDTDPHLTALGHSYGSLTTGLALQNQTGVDDAVFFGSPGIGTDHIGDLDVPEGHAFRVEARNDVVADLGGTASFGIDPSHLDGMVGLSAEESEIDGQTFAESTGHSAYLNDETTSQHNMAVTVAGIPDRMVEDGGHGVGDWLSWPVPGTY